MIAAVVNVVSHPQRKVLLHGFDVGGFLYRANGISRTSQQRLQGLLLFLLVAGLMEDCRLSILAVENMRSHPTAGVAVDAGAIHIDVAADVFRSTLTQLCHDLASLALSSILGSDRANRQFSASHSVDCIEGKMLALATWEVRSQ